ncbi:MAG: flagellin [Burkholderiaceae bacterium]|nr:flagellin [Burkholderiaceae bacterium]
MFAQSTLTASQSGVASSIEQLSTGLRINSAADDAAGYAIAQRMTAQINGYDQAGQNANDGISMLQVANGAIEQMTRNFQTVRTIAVEAANPVYSLSDRQALQLQINQLIANNAQIAQQTDFNGSKLLDGSFVNQQLQIGANANQTMMLTIPPAFPQSSGTATVQEPLLQATTSGSPVGAITAGDLTINGVSIAGSVAGGQAGQSSASAWAIANAINAANIHSLSATASSSIAASVTGGANIAAGDLTINGIAIGAMSGANGGALANSAAAAIEAAAGSTGVSASAAGGNLTLSTTDGRAIQIGASGSAGALNLISTNGAVTLTTTVSTAQSSIVIGGANPGNAGFTPGTFHAVASGGTAPVAVAVADTIVDVSSTANAEQSISYVDTLIDNCNGLGAYLGASQVALTAIQSTLANSSVNLSTAQARIEDTDYASATASLVRGQILQNASMSMLTQANALPGNVIRLLIRG